VPSNWAQVVKNFTEKVTEEHYELAKTWLFPNPEPGDILMPAQNSANHNKSHETPSEQETFSHSNVSSNMLPTGTQSSFCVDPFSSTAERISQQDYFPDPLLHSVLPSQEKASQNDHLLSVPPLFNLETSGLRGSPRITALNDTTQDGPAIVAYTSSTTQPYSQRIVRPKPKLFFLSVFTSVGAQWNFATSIPHSDNEHLSFVAQIANEFEQINGLFDEMINEICHHIQAYTTSHECFSYSQMLHEDDRI
jgi:hypothetical protein